MPKEYPAEFKTKIIKRYQKGESIQSLSQELHIAQSTLYDWRREYCSIKTANRTYTPKEFDTLSRRLEKLEHELEIIRLTGYISNVPLQKKLVFLESLYQKSDNPYSVYELCEALDVARGTKLYPRKWTRDFDPWPRSADTHLTHRVRSAAPVL